MFLRLVPVMAAALASVGDLLLLYVAAAPRGDGSDVRLAWMLLAGHHLGVLAIPFYAVGYRQVAAAITRDGLARAVFLLGAFGAAIGATIHGITGVVIGVERAAAGAHAARSVPVAPFAGMAGADMVTPYAEYLLPLWIIVGVALVAGSIAFAVATAGGASRYPRWVAALSPAALVVYIASIGGLTPAAPLIVPAAPNLAHLVFFAVTAVLASDSMDTPAARWRAQR